MWSNTQDYELLLHLTTKRCWTARTARNIDWSSSSLLNTMGFNWPRRHYWGICLRMILGGNRRWVWDLRIEVGATAFPVWYHLEFRSFRLRYRKVTCIHHSWSSYIYPYRLQIGERQKKEILAVQPHLNYLIIKLLQNLPFYYQQPTTTG